MLTSPQATAAMPLVEADIPRLRLPGRHSNEQMRDTLRAHPGRSVWVPGTLEYLLVNRWRNRRDISSIEELSAVRHLPALVEQAVAQCRLHGDELLLALELELETHRGRSRFERAGLEPLEDVITYEIETARATMSPPRRVQVRPVFPGDLHEIDQLVALDNAAFPWLWRNSREEFLEYLNTPGVRVLLLGNSNEAVAYIGVTEFDGWGHIDRVAVSPETQGHGFGQTAVLHGIQWLRNRGARRAGLSTQGTNLRSQRLYERLGFVRTPELDYQLYGVWTSASPASLSSR